MRATVSEAGEYKLASAESEFPVPAVQRFLAGNQMVVHFVATASPGLEHFCGQTSLDSLISSAGDNISLITVAPLP